jgi:hypothetical protein
MKKIMKITLTISLFFAYITIPTSAIVPPADHLYEYSYPNEKVSIETIYFDGIILYLFVYCASECTIVVFDPENARPYFDRDKLTEIFKNLETRNYIKAKNVDPSLYDIVLNDLGVSGASSCRALDYTDVVIDTTIIQTENAVISYLPKNNRQSALLIASVINKATGIRKYSIPIIVLSVACWGEDVTLNKFAMNGKTSKESIQNLNNNVFLSGQPDMLFSSHEKFVLSLQAQKFTLKTFENALLVGIKNLLGGDEEYLVTKINKWHGKTSIYFKREELNSINANAIKSSDKSIFRLNQLKNEVTANISVLSQEIQTEATKQKNKFPFNLLFDYNYSTVDRKLSIASGFLEDAQTSLQEYKYRTALQQLQNGYIALDEAKSIRAEAERTWPTLWKLVLWTIAIGLFYLGRKGSALLLIIILVILSLFSGFYQF